MIDFLLSGPRTLLDALALPHNRTPDWDAAQHAIDTIELPVLWDAGNMFDWEGWLLPWDAPNPPAARGVFVAIREARAELSGELAVVQAALTAAEHRDLVVVDAPVRATIRDRRAERRGLADGAG